MHAYANWVVDNMKNKLEHTPQYRIVDIQKDNEGIIAFYLIVCHRRKNVVFELIGSYEDIYTNMKAYCHQINITNLGSYIEVEIDKKKNCFLQLFVPYNRCLQGLQHC